MSLEYQMKLMCEPCPLFQKGGCVVRQDRARNATAGLCIEAKKTNPEGNRLMASKRIRLLKRWTWGWQTRDK